MDIGHISETFQNQQGYILRLYNKYYHIKIIYILYNANIELEQNPQLFDR